MSTDSCLPDFFDLRTMDWFSREVGLPTAVQTAAWPVIASGRHTLVSAPTGTGKTLAAFLVFIDRLRSEARLGQLKPEVKLIYVSPLKSLAGDIRENLRRPLLGLASEDRQANSESFALLSDIKVSIRTGDTSQSERRQMIKHPPHILITTPESLYLMLTSKSGQQILKTARCLIIDELHALIDSKRGAHLMLSVARLDRLCGKPLQRIGLSATIRPLERAAAYLSPDPVVIVDPDMRKDMKLVVTHPFAGARRTHNDNVWQDIANSIYKRCQNSRTVIAFLEARAYAEKLAYYVNQLAGGDFAQTHHGSLSRERRHEVEQELRQGTLRLLCATSSMELGIDIGEVDQVFQIGCPRTISSTLQRLGRAGHNPGRTSIMVIFPRTPSEALFSGLTAAVVQTGEVESCHPPRLCFDVLAQHLVSMAASESYTVNDVLSLLSRAGPFQDVSRRDIQDVLSMLAGDEEHARDLPVRPRVLYDRIHEQVTGDQYSRMLAVSAGGTIPDRGLYSVQTQQGVMLGQLDEEFVFEARVGDKFLLGSFAWKISQVKKDSVIVAPTSVSGAQPPFWKGEIKGRSLEIGLAFGRQLRQLNRAHEHGQLPETLTAMSMTAETTEDVTFFLSTQFAATGVLPDDQTILLEHFSDQKGNRQLMVHAVFGRQVNEPLAILAARQASKICGVYVQYVADDDGFLLYAFGGSGLPEHLLSQITSVSVKALLETVLPMTPVFNMAFRYNAARALMMGIRKAGRQPLWLQRLRAADLLEALADQPQHPLMRETRRECLEDYWDLKGVEHILAQISTGTIHLREMRLEQPSPLSLPLRQQTEAEMMYDYAPVTPATRASVEQKLSTEEMIAPDSEHLSRQGIKLRRPDNEAQLHALLLMAGDLQADELDVPVEWLESLLRQERVCYIEPGLWIAAEQEADYEAARSGNQDQRLLMVRRLLLYRGAHEPRQVSERYDWPAEDARHILSTLCSDRGAVEYEGRYYHISQFETARRETLKSRRLEGKTSDAASYAALRAGRVSLSVPQEEQLELALRALSLAPYPPDWWESALLPVRAAAYRPDRLDDLLAQGKFFWRFYSEHQLSFYRYEDIDWEADLTLTDQQLTDREAALYETLLKRGPSFLHRLTDADNRDWAPAALISLAEKGLVCADSFLPVRQWLERQKLARKPVKQQMKARAMAQMTGRWEIVRPLLAQSDTQKLELAFERAAILCRETITELSWSQALDILRIWEYTGRVRRGYFVSGLSGIQFIRGQDYAAVIQRLKQPADQIIWISASDPDQVWGKCLGHLPDRAFLNVAGAFVALKSGLPVAVFEKQGTLLRVFDETCLTDVLQAFARSYNQKRLLIHLNRVTVREYPEDAVPGLLQAGFVRVVNDYVLYRSY